VLLLSGRYMDRIMRKRKEGQPVSFTDFFGHMVGETLLGDVSGCLDYMPLYYVGF